MPDLQEKKRVGVIKSLHVKAEKGTDLANFSIKSGGVEEELFFFTPRSPPLTLSNFSQLLKNTEPPFFYSSFPKIASLKAYERIILSFFVWQVLQTKNS